jgi:hypothetical protein
MSDPAGFDNAMVRANPSPSSEQKREASPAPFSPLPADRPLKIDRNLQRCRIILQRFNKILANDTPLTDQQIEQLAQVIGYCSKLGKDAKPLLEKWTIAKALLRVLRASKILPDFIPPQITMLIEAWDHDEYNLAPQANTEVSEDSDHEDSKMDVTDVPEDENVVTQARGTAMRGINIGRSTLGHLTYALNKAAQRPYNVFGHNGLKVGAWWPMQICALRDGAHGSLMGGIAGKRDLGAYSIILSGGGGYNDRDLGDIVHYTGSGKPGADQHLTTANQALTTSWLTQLPVRVLRSSKSDSDYAPSRGLRYDGLYRVIEQGQEPDRDGFLVYRFKLTRLLGQDPIRRDVPTQDDLNTL